MRREEFLTKSPSRASSYPVFRSREEALAELRRPCSRFTSIIPADETLRTFIAEKMAEIDTLSSSLFLGDVTPLNWQRLLQYLHEKSIIPSPRFGIRQYRNDYPRFFPIMELTGAMPTTDGRDVAIAGFGVSTDREQAMSKAVGEMLERHFLAAYSRKRLEVGSYAELSKWGKALDTTKIDFFADWQKKRFPGFATNAESTFTWIQGREFESGESIYLPAQMVFWNYDFTPQGQSREKTLCLQTTSGAAGHFSRDEAVLAALLEAIQRDAFLIYWLNTITPTRIDISSSGLTQLTDMVETLRTFQLEPVFLNTTSDLGIPTATCVLVDRSQPDDPTYALGSSAGFTLEDTLLSSLVEAYLVHHHVVQHDAYTLPEDYEPFVSTTLSRHERLHTWRGKKMAERFAFFLAGETQSANKFIGNSPRFDTHTKQLAHIASEFLSRGNGYKMYTYEVKNDMLDSLGYHIVRVIVPELIPLYLTEFAATLNAKRLREVPAKIGRKTAEKFNPWPHPFP